MNRKGFALIGVIIAVAAAAIAIVPISRWFMTLNTGTDDLQTRMMMQSILQDKWNSINAERFDELAEAIASKGTTWTDYAGANNRYKIDTVFGDERKYASAQCMDEAAGEDDRKCRKVSLQITDTQTGQTQTIDVTKIATENGGGGGSGGTLDMAHSQALSPGLTVLKKGGWVLCDSNAKVTINGVYEPGLTLGTGSQTVSTGQQRCEYYGDADGGCYDVYTDVTTFSQVYIVGPQGKFSFAQTYLSGWGFNRYYGSCRYYPYM